MGGSKNVTVKTHPLKGKPQRVWERQLPSAARPEESPLLPK